MNKISLKIHDDVVEVLSKIKSAEGTNVKIEIPEGSVLFDNVVNLKLIIKEAEQLSKSIEFFTDDPHGNTILAMLDSGGESEKFDGFMSKEVPVDGDADVGKPSKKSSKKLPSMPKVPSFSIPKISLPKLNLKLPLLILVVVGVLGFAAYSFLWQAPEATVKVIVSSQPLTKSLTLQIKADAETDVENKILRGETVTATVSDSMSTETTGEKIVGDKAEGTVTIYNRTDVEKEFKKGTQMTFKGDNDDIIFKTKDGVTVPAETLEDPLDPTSPSIPGQIDVDVEALEIGKSGNIDDGETLEFEDFKKSEYFAQSKDSFEGGSSETVKTVAQEDMDKLSEDLATSLKESSVSSLEKKLTKGRKQIPGSQEVTVSSEEFSAELDDEEEELTLTQVGTATVLVYNEKDLDKMLDGLVDGLIPDGFALSDKDREINVEVLGSSDGTVLSLDEADIQVTLKAFVVPNIDEQKIKEELSGKNIVEAEKVLGGVRNVDTYELELLNALPFMQKFPQNTEKIMLTVELE